MGPVGPVKGLGILSHSSKEKVFTHYGTDSTGMTMTSVAKGTVQGDTWTYTDESKMGGKTINGRYIIKVVSPSSYTFKWKMQGEGGQWLTIVEGKSTKAQ
jgi:hypothetical protein